MIKTSGIVLKTTRYGETSLIVTLLTRDFGKVSAIANNARTNRSRMLAGLQLFAYSEIVMYKAKSKNGLYHLDEMNVLHGFDGIRTDLDKTAYASYFSEAALGAVAEDSPDEELLTLLLNSLFAIEKELCSFEKVKTVFEWRMAAELGYAPELERCGGCGAGDKIFGLSLSEGTVFCDTCQSSHQGVAKLSSGMLKIIGYIIGAEGKKIFSFDTNEKTISYLSRVSEAYLSAQLDREFKTLSYLKKVTALGDINNANKN